jgi:hypothetical protein
MSSRHLAGWAAAFSLLSVPLCAQEIVAARAGLVHFSDGRVLLNEKAIAHKIGQYPEVKELEYLRTEQGRAEMLLTPGIFLRLGEDSQVQMLSTRLTDVRFRLLAGSAVVEADELNKDNSVIITIGDTQVRLLQRGLYHLDAGDGPRLRVFTGEALVTTSDGVQYHVKNKREIELARDFAITKFDPEDTDPLDRWSKRRANYLSAANVSASRIAYNRGLAFSSSSWIFNPFFGMYTFLPYRNIAWSPYGCPFYSPVAVYRYYNPPAPSYTNSGMSAYTPPSTSYNSAGGYTSVGQTSTGNSGVMATSSQSSVSQGGGGSVSHGSTTSGGGGRR